MRVLDGQFKRMRAQGGAGTFPENPSGTGIYTVKQTALYSPLLHASVPVTQLVASRQPPHVELLTQIVAGER